MKEKHDSKVVSEQPVGAAEEDYQWWREARFGIFIHWNMSSMLDLEKGFHARATGTHLVKKASNSTTPGKVPQAIQDGSYLKYRGAKKVPQEIYDNLYQRFNPKNFDAREWVETFKAAGAKYIVLTTKHNDGFCMFDSKHTDYDIMNTPFGRDIAKELSDACHKAGIKVIWYYSKPDSYAPCYDVDNPLPYQEYMLGHIRELCTNYGDIKGFWWDGGRTGTAEVDGKEGCKVIYEHRPGAIYNGRAFKTMPMPGIKFTTPEQKLGAFNMGRPWETCAVMEGESWFWNGGKDIKSLNACLRLLIDSSIGDGNLLLDFGPTSEGTIYETFKERFLGMGKWLNRYGESIYGCRGGPLMPGSWGGSTRKGNAVYLHITQEWPGGILNLPALPAKIVSCTALTGGEVDFKQTAEDLQIEMDASHHRQPDTIVRLELDRPAMQLEPIPAPKRIPLNVAAKVTASSEMVSENKGFARSVSPFPEEIDAEQERNYNREMPEQMVAKYPWIKKGRGSVGRCWMAKGDDEQPWIELDLGEVKQFDRINVVQKYNRIQAYEIQYHDGRVYLLLQK